LIEFSISQLAQLKQPAEDMFA